MKLGRIIVKWKREALKSELCLSFFNYYDKDLPGTYIFFSPEIYESTNTAQLYVKRLSEKQMINLYPLQNTFPFQKLRVEIGNASFLLKL